MKKRIPLLIWVLCAGILSMAQAPKDPQQEMNQVQQKIRMLQSADQQIRGQVTSMKKHQDTLERQLRSSLAAGDSVIKTGLDSVRVANVRLLENEKQIASLRSSLSLQQNLVIVALVLILCLIFLFLWQRRVIRNLALGHEEDVKKLGETMEKGSSEVKATIDGVKQEFSSKSVALQDNISKVSQQAESATNTVRSELTAKLSGLDETLRKTVETEKTAREGAIAGVTGKLSALDEKVESGTANAMTFAKQEAEKYRKELSEIRKSLQEVSRGSKGRGNSAE